MLLKAAGLAVASSVRSPPRKHVLDAPVSNLLLARLPLSIRSAVLTSAEPWTPVPNEALAHAGLRTPHVFFPTRGYAALLTSTAEHPDVEVGMVGREGMYGAHLALGVMESPLHAVVQGAGEVLRVPTRAFLTLLDRNPVLHEVVRKYLYVRMSQIATSSGCKRFHEMTPRLARWLLMCQDRAQCDRFEVSHSVLAGLLGVRRVSVTVAATELRLAGLIDYHRGAVHIGDRKGLLGAACSCYAADSDVYSSVFPAAPRR